MNKRKMLDVFLLWETIPCAARSYWLHRIGAGLDPADKAPLLSMRGLPVMKKNWQMPVRMSKTTDSSLALFTLYGAANLSNVAVMLRA
jgi:hypothetical protein